MKGSHLSIDYLHVFRELAKSRNFRKTATSHFLTQSAISQQLAYLEKHFGKKLIDRGKGQFHLTPAGLTVLQAANDILDIERKLRETLRQTTNILSGSIKAEASYSVGLYLLPPLVREFLKKNPKVSLNLEYLHSDRILADVLAGTCDLGVVVLPCADSEKFDIAPFLRERLVFVCSPYHPNASKKKIALADLRNENFVAFNTNLQTRKIIDAVFAKRKINVNIVHESENVETLKRIVEVGGGVSLLPETTVAQEIKNKTLRALPLSDGPLYREAGFVMKRGRHTTPTTRAFFEWCLRHKQLSPRPG